MNAIRTWDWVILFFVGCSEIWILAWMAPIYKSVLVNSAIAAGASLWSSRLGLACLLLLAALTHVELTGTWTLWFYQDVVLWKHFPHYWPFVREAMGHRWIPATKGRNAEPFWASKNWHHLTARQCALVWIWRITDQSNIRNTFFLAK